MIMTLLDTQKSLQKTNQFDSDEHLRDRKHRAETGWIGNPALPGLRTVEINISEKLLLIFCDIFINLFVIPLIAEDKTITL